MPRASKKLGGRNENTEGDIPKKTSRIDDLAKHSGMIIYEARSVRFLDLSPNKISVCPNRVTLTYSNLFQKYEYPLPIENINGARVSRGLLYSTLLIETFGYERPEPLKHLMHRDARLVRRYILGLVECKKNGVDLLGLELPEIKEKLRIIGMVRHDSNDKNYFF